MAEDFNGDLWLLRCYKGVNYVDKINPYQLCRKNPFFTHFLSTPSATIIAVGVLMVEVKASTEAGLAKYSLQVNLLNPTPPWAGICQRNNRLRILKPGKNGNNWFEAYNFPANTMA
jgi:hypothetical protein